MINLLYEVQHVNQLFDKSIRMVSSSNIFTQGLTSDGSYGFRRALILGSSSGIGFSITKKLLENNHNFLSILRFRFPNNRL